ncbi:MAG TPA: Ig-like domain-containing protein [Candidatus Limnocylindrales bacterium]|nr:Ig-like domain-containing protein [Candidatus Limnocylindrales bacterium]
MTTRRGGRPPQVRPRPPSTGRPTTTKVRPRPPAPNRLAAHRRIERGPGVALPFRLLMVVAVAALGIGVLLVATGGLGRIAAAIGTTFDGFVGDLTATPEPSEGPLVATDSPTLEAPVEPYTNQATVDVAGTLPAAAVGQVDSIIRLYVTIGEGEPGVVAEIPIGTSPRFLFPSVELSPGRNTFAATIVGAADLESEPSASVIFVLDNSKPGIKITSPKTNAEVNAKSVRVEGKTQGRSAISVRNASTNATVAGSADNSGAFGIVVPLRAGQNTIEVTVTDPAGNVNKASVVVRRGTGALTARVAASFYTVKLAKLPEEVELTVLVTDPDGQALAGAEVTFTLAVPGVPAIASSTLTTSDRGTASFSTTIPKGATAGQCSVTVIVRTKDHGDTTDRTVITLQK